MASEEECHDTIATLESIAVNDEYKLGAGTGGGVTIVQPVDGRLREGMAMRIEGSGENAGVLPR